jgi:hypothetical protein
MKKNATTIRSIALLLLVFVFQGCYEEGMRNSTVEGYRPVYGSLDVSEMKLTTPRIVKSPGKIYVYGQYLLINEINQGIHVYDNLDPENPAAIGFIQLIGNSDMAVRNDVLYADHMGNIVALNIQDFENITQHASLPLQNWNLGLPAPPGFYFECAEPEKGLVVNWKKTQIKNPRCYANN